MSGKKLGYVRVSSTDQNAERQLEGLTLNRTFIDKVSGKDVVRPALQELLDYARDDDTVIVHSMDRLARNLSDLKEIVAELTKKGAKVQFIKEGLVFTAEKSPMSELILNVMGAFAEFERALIRERQREGIELAKQRGVYRGRKKRLSDIQIAEMVARLEVQTNKAEVAREYRISRETLYKYLRDVKSKEESENEKQQRRGVPKQGRSAKVKRSGAGNR